MVLTKKQIHILIYLNGILNGPVVIYITEPRSNVSWAIFWRIPPTIIGLVYGKSFTGTPHI